MHNRLPLVLIPSDDYEWVANFADGYRANGYDVIAGMVNFRLAGCGPTIVHLLWPEEYTRGRIPTSKQIAEISARLDWWARQATLIFSVSNLYPHVNQGDAMFHALYTAFYQRADVIHHFSHAAKELVCAEYPAISGRNHVVFSGYNYERLLPAQPVDRAAARQYFGFEESDIVYLAFGQMRSWEEVRLLRRGFRLAKNSHIRVQVSARYQGTGRTRVLRFYREQLWKRWSGGTCSWNPGGFVPPDILPVLLAAVDVVVVVRPHSINSGVTSLAMTFGKMLVVPKIGGNEEYVRGTGNILYDSTSAEDLARAIDEAACANRDEIGLANRQITAEWNWARIIRCCLDALPHGSERVAAAEKPQDQANAFSI